MKDYFRLSRSQSAFMIPTALYILWQSCVGWLSHYWTFIHLGRDLAALLYIVFFLAHAGGMAGFAIWLDRRPEVERIKKTMLLSTVLTAVFTAAMAYVQGGGLFLICLSSGLVSGLFMAYLSHFVFQAIPVERRGLTIGIAAALGLTVHFIAFTLLFPQQEGAILYGKTFFASITALLIGSSALFLPVCRDYLWQTDTLAAPPERGSDSLKPGLIAPLVLILVGFFLSFGMQDYAATAFWLGGVDYLVYTRVFLILGFIGGGVLCDLRGKHMVLNSSFSLLAMGFVSMAFQYRGGFAFVGFSCVQMAGAVFSSASQLIFMDIARFYKKQVLVCSLGLVFPLVLKQFGIISADILYKTLGNMSIFLVSLIAIIAVLPLVSVLFEKIRTIGIVSIRQQSPVINLASTLDSTSVEMENGLSLPDHQSMIEPDSTPLDNQTIHEQTASGLADIAENFAQKYGFTHRETQVLELTLHGLSVAEMAHTLNVSEPTIKQYVRQMLRKTETKNRRQLLSMMIKEQNPG
ncbi:MAG TPA: LuxR family transcriptional regulator [Syntrophomonadaceae bacterium]|nr:LuxR family transcriptional regulator [Syntrophomonadaceae bacterium]